MKERKKVRHFPLTPVNPTAASRFSRITPFNPTAVTGWKGQTSTFPREVLKCSKSGRLRKRRSPKVIQK